MQLTGRPALDNSRIVVTQSAPDAALHLREGLLRGGDIENRIKELHGGLQLNRTSSSRFRANRIRLAGNSSTNTG